MTVSGSQVLIYIYIYIYIYIHNSIRHWRLVLFYIHIMKRIVCPPIWFVSIVRIIYIQLNINISILYILSCIMLHYCYYEIIVGSWNSPWVQSFGKIGWKCFCRVGADRFTTLTYVSVIVLDQLKIILQENIFLIALIILNFMR